MTLKLLEYKYSKHNDTFANFLIIEEPEAHIHTHIQKTLFDNLDFDETQIIYSTHSTHISEVSKISSMNILAKKQNYAEVYYPSKGLKHLEITKLERYLDAVRNNLLFAKGVILVEGDAEEILIPILIKKVFGTSLDELGISLINIRSTGFKNVAQLFHKDRIRRKCAIITDLDTAIIDKDKEAEKKGAERKIILDEFSKDNKWIKAFYAEYTFEVEFLADDNDYELIELVDEIYLQEKIRTLAKEELESDEIKKYGTRVLKMANKVGKGWFAVMLGKHISFKTFIPDYILKAIIYAKDGFTVETITNIIKYRISKLKEEENMNIVFNEAETKINDFANRVIDKEELRTELKSLIKDYEINHFLENIV